jgi:biopolymer transport protein ExbD
VSNQPKGGKKKRRKHGAGNDGVDVTVSELNLVPYLDVMVNIIMFLLLTVTSWVQFAVANATLPNYNTASSGTSKDDKKEDEKIDLTVLVTDKGFTLAGRGGVLGGAGGTGPTIPCATSPCRIVKTSSGEAWNYDYAKLTEKVADIKGKYPKEDTVTISGAPLIHYEVVVGVWDAVRGNYEGCQGAKTRPPWPTCKLMFEKVLFGPEVR